MCRDSASTTLQQGDELYANQSRSKVEDGNERKIVAIDKEAGAYKLADDMMTATNATKQLYEQYPDAQLWVVRIGHLAVHRFGARSLKKTT